jgi:hypothetical protein
MVAFKILDVGCGGRPKGDVNCDLFVGESPHTNLDLIRNKSTVSLRSGGWIKWL